VYVCFFLNEIKGPSYKEKSIIGTNILIGGGVYFSKIMLKLEQFN
jgi:hypothetical protein